MSELKHWLDEASDADEFERSILRSGFEIDPPKTSQDQVWSSLLGALAIAPVVAATTGAQTATAKAAATGVSKASAIWLAVAKGFVMGLAVYGAAAGVSEISNRINTRRQAPPSTARKAPAPTRTSTSARLTRTPTPALTSASVVDDTTLTPRLTRGNGPARPPANLDKELPAVATFDGAGSHNGARGSQLEGETRALRRARNELRLGELADAFATLEASRRQFPAPELYQEHEALMIELLYRSGQVSTAEQRARAFLEHFPESPHAQQIRQLTRR